MAHEPHDKSILGKLLLAAAGTTVAVGAGAGVAEHRDRLHTGVDEEFIHYLQEKDAVKDETTTLARQLIKTPASLYPLCTLSELAGEAYQTSLQLSKTGKPTEETISVISPVPADKNQAVHFEVIGAAKHDSETSLKALALYEHTTHTVFLIFPGISFSKDSHILANTLAGEPLPTQEGVRTFMRQVNQTIREKNLSPKNMIIFGNSLGAGSAIYARDEAMRSSVLPKGAMPRTVLLEPWGAKAALDITSENGEFSKTLGLSEVRFYPGTHTSQNKYNPPLDGAAYVIVPVGKYKYGIGRAAAHDYIQQRKDLLGGELKLVSVLPQELEKIEPSRTAQGVTAAIRTANQIPAVRKVAERALRSWIERGSDKEPDSLER